MSNWQTIAAAGKALDISERQARRYAGKLDPKDRQEPDTGAGTPLKVNLEAMREMRDKVRGQQTLDMSLVRVEVQAGQEADAEQMKAGQTPDAILSVNGNYAGQEPDVEQQRAGQQESATPDAGRTPNAGQSDTAEISLLRLQLEEARARETRERELNEFLRAQIEEGNRNAAELRAALRKALEIAPRQLEAAPDAVSAATSSTSAPTRPEPQETLTTAQVQNERPEPRPIWKVILGIR